MSELSRCQFYCLSYYKENIENMKSRFKNLDIECKFYSGVHKNNEKIKNNKYNNHKKRQLSMMYGHLNIFKDFYYNTNCRLDSSMCFYACQHQYSFYTKNQENLRCFHTKIVHLKNYQCRNV